jgi:hypothetical protein
MMISAFGRQVSIIISKLPLLFDQCTMDLLCPSSIGAADGSAKVFGVVNEDGCTKQTHYLSKPVLLTSDLLELTAPISPDSVLRVANACAEAACVHFDGERCRLASRIRQNLEPVVSALPRCGIRPGCRWWRQEGAEACRRCPQIIRESFSDNERFAETAGNAPFPP